MNCTPEELRHIFESYRSVLLTAHVSPDGDALGSLAAMAAWLKSRGKDVLVVIDDTIDDTFRRSARRRTGGSGAAVGCP